MGTIVFQNPKGGVSKSTLALLTATTLAHAGRSVALLDADHNQPQKFWEQVSINNDRVIENIIVFPEDGQVIDERNVLDVIDDCTKKFDYVIVDLAGDPNMTHSYCLSRADLVMIPIQSKILDAANAAKTLELINRTQKASKLTIPHAMVLTRQNQVIKSRNAKAVDEQVHQIDVPLISVKLFEMDPFSALFQYGGDLYTLPAEAVPKRRKDGVSSSLDKAIENAEAVCKEIVGHLHGVMKDVA